MKVGASSHPRTGDTVIGYGTAGFRTKAELLDHVMYRWATPVTTFLHGLPRMGLLAVLRSRAQGGQTIGAMITASHNPGPDNGIKLVEPAGEMLEQSWESLATALANCPDSGLAEELEGIVERFSLGRSGGRVVLGRDTRLSSPALREVGAASPAASDCPCRPV